MSGRVEQIAAIVRADFFIRFRRSSTLVIFLVIGLSAYIWIPDPASGWALLEVDGHRVIYNSASIAIGTAVLGTILIGLLGFYVISNALRTDVRSRCGFVIASTNMRSTDYLVGKFLGNVAFLAVFMTGYMIASMAMVVVRGEAGLEPLSFVRHYLMLAPQMILFVSAAAVLFESVRILSGRIGDVVWFTFWMLWMGAPAMLLEVAKAPLVLRYLDFSGLAFLLSRMNQALGTTEISIGAAQFDPAKTPMVIDNLTMSPDWIAPRIGAAVLPLFLLPVALLFFHRFDPARLRPRKRKSHFDWLGKSERLLKPLTRVFDAFDLDSKRSAPSLSASAREDARITIASAPLLAMSIPVAAILALTLPLTAMQRGLLPAVLAILAVLVADVPVRERNNGLFGMISSVPGLKSGFVRWKLMSLVVVSLAFVIIPLIRLSISDPASSVSLLVGTLLVCSAALALGVVSSNPKTFLVLVFIFGYVVVNDGGRTPALDVAGFYSVATPNVTLAYLMIAAGLVAVAQLVHSARLRREGC